MLWGVEVEKGRNNNEKDEMGRIWTDAGWYSSNFEEIPWYAEKGSTRAYLAEINKDKKVYPPLLPPPTPRYINKLTIPGHRIYTLPTRFHK